MYNAFQIANYTFEDCIAPLLPNIMLPTPESEDKFISLTSFFKLKQLIVLNTVQYYQLHPCA